MAKKSLDEKYSYQIDEHNVVHLFRGGDDCQQYLTNPLLSAIFKIETLEEESKKIINQLLNIIYTESRTDIYTNEIFAAEEYLAKELPCT